VVKEVWGTRFLRISWGSALSLIYTKKAVGPGRISLQPGYPYEAASLYRGFTVVQGCLSLQIPGEQQIFQRSSEHP
jgi:hypothetical protein